MIKYRQISAQQQQDIDNIVFRGRIIWREIATWISAYLITKTLRADTELQEQIINKILNVSADFGSMMRVFFGDKAADDYNKLFSNYIKLIIDLIDALVEGNSSAANEIVKQIYQTAGERAEFLSQVNPYWDKSTLEKYIFEFTEMIIREANAFINKQYKDSIDIYDRILSYSTSLGDFMAQGIKDYLMYNLQQPTTI
nr:hypothetical protein [uncultured Aminipila sp.]